MFEQFEVGALLLRRLLVQHDECIDNRLEGFSRDRLQMNAIINHEPIRYGEIAVLPFTGEFVVPAHFIRTAFVFFR